MVRLLPSSPSLPDPSAALFQSHNGAIAAARELGTSRAVAIVSIPQWCDCCGCKRATDGGVAVVFQSHNGAIAASRRQMNTSSFSKFQSHNGAIAAVGEQVQDACQYSVVSIPQWCDCCMQYLERIICETLFQSHNGAIAAPIALNAPAAIDACFNPTMVRLLRTRLGAGRAGVMMVSIPQWCDCCNPQAKQDPEFIARFNPTMVRLLRCGLCND